MSDLISSFKPGDRIGHYSIIALIGRGGMGEVYLATDEKLGRRVAIKIISAEFSSNDSSVRRFLQEARAASGLNHPNILTVHEIGEFDGSNYLVSEYIDGKSLRDIIDDGSLKSAAAIDIAVQAASGLSVAHDANIVHRDIKPENICIRSDGYVKILDFGLAKLHRQRPSRVEHENETLAQNMTADGSIMGTVSYMSPEQARGDVVDSRSDIFSLGIVIYEMLSGRTPFDAPSKPEILANLMRRDPAPLARYSSDLPDGCERIVSKMLRKDPDERYQTMRGLLADLKELDRETNRESGQREPATIGRNQTAIFDTQAIAGNVTANATSSNRVFPKTLLFIFSGAIILAALAAGTWYFRGATTAASPQIRSLTVLPLKSLDSGENYLGLGIADAVIRKISQTGGIIVRPTSSVRRFVNENEDALTVAREMNTDSVLEGSFLRSGDRLRVSVNLLRVSDGNSLWSDSFDLQTSDIFAIQDSVAQQVAGRLKLQLDPAQGKGLQKRYTSDPVAYEYYVKGIYNLDQRGYGLAQLGQMQSTIDLFKKAIEADPNFALAHAQLAIAYSWTALFIDPGEHGWEKLAYEEISRSQAIDPQLAESHLAKAQLLWSAYGGFQDQAALRELQLAQKLDPNVGHGDLGGIFMHVGLNEAATREIQRAIDIDPTSFGGRDLYLTQYEITNRYDEYAEAYAKLHHEPFKPSAWYLLGKRRVDEAASAIKSPLSDTDIDVASARATIFALRGDKKAAEAEIPTILNIYSIYNPGRHHATYRAACVYAIDGNSSEAVKLLKETANTGFPNYPLFRDDPYLDPIRQSPEFLQFMSEMKDRWEHFRTEFDN